MQSPNLQQHPQPQRLQPSLPQQPTVASPSQTHVEYAKRASAGTPTNPGHAPLDPHGRRAPQARSLEEEQLEIPAFLRRQVNS